ncbi:MAG: hypothetical protein AB7U97_18015, partial [Pirellulales bacterium]
MSIVSTSAMLTVADISPPKVESLTPTILPAMLSPLPVSTLLPEIVLSTTVNVLSEKMPPPLPMALLPLIVLRLTATFAVCDAERIAPPSPGAFPLNSVRPSMLKAPVAAVKLKIRDFNWASIVSRSRPGPSIVSDSLIVSSPSETGNVTGPAAVSAGAKSIVSAPGAALAAAIASRSDVCPSPASTKSESVSTVIA